MSVGVPDDMITRLQEMVSAFSYRSDISKKLSVNAELNRRERAELAGQSRAYGLCATELAFALRMVLQSTADGITAAKVDR